MNLPTQTASRLAFLVRVVLKECRHLEGTDQRLFTQPFTPQRVASLETDQNWRNESRLLLDASAVCKIA